VRHAYPDGKGTVTATARREGDDLVLVIADRGVGIAADRAPTRSLGSTIATALARQIGARSETATAPGDGTAVTLRVPLRQPEGEPAATGS
jgi:two-component sensor histidine kinase